MFSSCCFCCGGPREMAPRMHSDSQSSSCMIGCSDFCCNSGMSEGRQSQVVLLDDYHLDILIKPKLYAGELLDMVASHFSLKEKEYFGISYIDDTGHYNWLQLERRVLEHEFPKKSSQSPLLLFFRIKYFVESITHLRDSASIEAFYLQAQSLVYQGAIEVTSCEAFRLASLVLQAGHGDYVNDDITKQHLKKLNVIPTSTLLEHPSLPICERKVTEEYKTLTGLPRGNAIVNYMQIVESLPTYGVHYFEVKDKAGLPWWLGISYRGIYQYDLTDKKVPRKAFLWKQLENLYFRDRKFSIEVCDPKRPSTSRKGFGTGNISVYVWFAVTPSLTKCIWSMAISQHQFYLDRKHNKASLPIPRNLTDIALELSNDGIRSVSTDSTSLSRSGSTHSLPALKISGDSWDNRTTETVEMLVSLKARKEALEEALHQKCEELKKLCLQEGELTGVVPAEMPLSPGEHIPLMRKRLGSEFSLEDRLSWKKKTKEEEELIQLELQYEIQKKIVSSSAKLASDPGTKKGVRRQRKVSHQKAQSKLKEIEQKLLMFRKKIAKLKKERLKQYSDDELSEDNLSHSTDENDSCPTEMGHFNHCLVSEGSKDSLDTSSSSPLTSIIVTPNSSSAPSSPMKIRQLYKTNHHSPAKPPPQRSSLVIDRQGYTPNSVYKTRTSYRSQQYPTLPTKIPTSKSAGAVLEFCEKPSVNKRNSNTTTVLSLMSPYQNKFESTLDIEGSNLYSVPTQRTSQAFDTQDDLLASLPQNQQDLGLASRHNSLDRRRRQSLQKQRYLESKQFDASSVASSTSYGKHLPLNQTMYEAEIHAGGQSENHHPHYFHHHPRISPRASDAERTFLTDDNQVYSNRQSCAPQSFATSKNPYASSDNTYHPYDRHHYAAMPVCDSCSKSYQLCRHQQPAYSESSRHYAMAGGGRTWESLVPDTMESRFRSLDLSSTSSERDHHMICASSPLPEIPSIENTIAVNVVRYGHIQPYWEETKPYEISDFYKYSTKHRQQQKSPCEKSEMKRNGNKSIYDSKKSDISSETASSEGFVCSGNRPVLPSENARLAEKSLLETNTMEQNVSEYDRFSCASPFPDKLVERHIKLEKLKKTTLV